MGQAVIGLDGGDSAIGSPQCAWRAGFVTSPDAPEIARRGKTGQLGDALDRQLPVGKQFARAGDTQPLLVADDADPCVLGKQPRQVPGADMRLPGQFFERPGAGRILRDGVLRAVHSRMQVVAMVQPRGKLRVIAAAALIYDQPTCDASGQFSAGVSQDWQKITAGKVDENSLLTVFLCLAVDTTPKAALSKAAARTLIGKVRKEGLQRQPALAFIRAFAPYAMQDDLEALWNEVFPELENALVDPADTSGSQALAYLKENCIIH